MTSSSTIVLIGAAGLAGAAAAVAAWRPGRPGGDRRLAAALASSSLESLAAFAAASGTLPHPVALALREGGHVLAAGAWVWFAFRYARETPRPGSGANWQAVLIGVLPGLCLLAAGGGSIQAGPEGSPHSISPQGLPVQAAGLLAAVFSLLQVERTFSASVGSVRHRISLVLAGAGLILASRLAAGGLLLVTRRIEAPLDVVAALGLLAGSTLVAAGLRRGGDAAPTVHPSRELRRRSVTVLLAGLYLLVLGLTANGLRAAGPTASTTTALVVLLCLPGITAALRTERVRLALQDLAPTWLRPRRRDARGIWLRLTSSTARCTDASALGRSVAELVSAEFAALSVSVWLADPGRRQLLPVANSAGIATDTESGNAVRIPLEPVAAHFLTRTTAEDLESSTAPWAEQLRAANPPVLAQPARRMLLPLSGHGEFIGLIVFGDHLDGPPSRDALRLLECVAAHTAASLQGLRLSQGLADLRQLEAFQGVAAFVIHDLKNASFVLSLMLQNLAAHFEKPAFRADALRSVAEAGRHLDGLIRRLGSLREGLRVETGRTDLNEIVSVALREVPHMEEVTIETDLAPLPPIDGDQTQLRKVVTNLVINATEAVAGRGRVRVSTATEDGWAVLSVGDDGCGMSERFVSESLFRPFRTTKPCGLGIGMFHSRSIVEAHGGRIDVRSRPGEGTEFRVFLRAAPVAAAA